MKRILIVNKSFETGGIQSSLVNMANELQKYYKVDLFVFNPTGPIKERLHEGITVLPTSWMIKTLGMSLREALETRDFAIIAFRIFAGLWSKLYNNSVPIELAIRSQERLEGYDLAIAYHQEQRKHSVVSGFSRVVDGCVGAKQKLAWLHYDCNTIDIDSAYNNLFYMKMDRIVCVSQSLGDVFARMFPDLKDKVEFCYNFIDYSSLKTKSLQRQSVVYPEKSIICFSACRLTKEKALVRAITCLSPVFRVHSNLMWYIAGSGPEHSRIENAIKETGMEKQIVLLGNLSNPYPYMKNADLLMNVSYHEAAPMVFLEAKALGTPIFATRTSSAEEMLSDPPCAFICENSEQGIYEAFLHIVENPQLIAQAKETLKEYSADNSQPLSKFAQWLAE